MSEQIYIDNSILSDVMSCSTRAWVRYVQHKQMRRQESKSQDAMKVGRLFHSLFERCLGKWESRTNLIQLSKDYGELFPEIPEQEKFYPSNLRTIAEVWLRHNSIYFRDHQVVTVEKRLEMPLGEGVTFFGTIDALTEDQAGNIWIVESKTTGWLQEDTKKYWQRGSQGMGYWALVTHNYGREPKGVVWNALEIGKVPPYDGNLNKKCQKHGVKYQECQPLHVNQEIVGPVVYRREQIAHWRDQTLFGAEKFRTLQANGDYVPIQYIPTEGLYTWPGCSKCQFTDWCWAGRPVEMMEGMMEEYVWPPVVPLYGGEE